MSIKNGYLGEKIQISNSPVSTSLRNKYDFYYGNNYEQVNTLILNVANLIANKLGLDLDKVGLLCSLFNIGKVDGGRITLDRINSLVGEGERISESDIAEYNIRRIFSDLEEVFSKKAYDEIFDMFHGKYDTLESKTVDYAADIVLVTEYLSKYHSLPLQEVIKYIRSAVDKLSQGYKENKTFVKDADVVRLSNQIKGVSFSYDFNTLDEYINSEYVSNDSKSKDLLIEVACKYDSELEKTLV